MNDDPYVTVTVQSTRIGFEAMLKAESMIAKGYDPLGITWANFMQAIRDALDKAQ